MKNESKPTWEYLMPVLFVAAGAYTGGAWAAVDFFIAGMWTAVLLAWHTGWRKTSPHSDDDGVTPEGMAAVRARSEQALAGRTFRSMSDPKRALTYGEPYKVNPSKLE